jgi:antitoxin component YwqK of YwqJK toxin-antitoxin module
MKKLIYLLVIVFFNSGCDTKLFLEQIGLEEEITHVIQIRNDVAYLPDENEPFTGKYEEYYSTNGQKKSETNYKDGKQNGLFASWYENGKKEYEENYEDGKQSGLFTNWYENEQKKSETNYIEGKVNGLYSLWYENGQKKTEINYKDGEVNGMFIWWYENGEKKINETR